MDLFGIIGTAIRRWYVSLPILLAASYFAVLSYQAVEPQYTGSISVVVLPSLPREPVEGQDPDAEELSNPFAGSGGGGTRFAAAVLSRNINGAAFRNRLEIAEESGVTFESSATPQQPMIKVDATANDPDTVVQVLDLISTEAAVVLDEFQAQAGTPPEVRYRLAPAVPVGSVEDVTPSRMRNAGAILVLGVVGAAVTSAIFDSILARRRRRAAASGRRDLLEPTQGISEASSDDVASASGGGGAPPNLVGTRPGVGGFPESDRRRGEK